MPGKDTKRAFDRNVGTMEAAPVALGQILYRAVLKNSDKGKKSADYQADLTSWLRQAQRGECDPEEACDIFSLSAAHWAFLAALGIMAGMLLDYVFGVSFDAVFTFSLSVFPAFSLLSAADAVRARLARGGNVAERTTKKRNEKGRMYIPITHRWLIPAAAPALLAAFWIVVFFTG